MGVNDVDGLLDAATACDHIFSDDKFFVLVDLKSAAQSESSCFFLDKNVTLAQSAADFLTNDDSSERRRDHSVAFEIAQAIGEQAADVGGDVRVLQ
jgi:hypothetical protein